VIWKALNFRREHRELFLEGEYLPLIGSGPEEKSVVAFCRHKDDEWALVAVSRLVAGLNGAQDAPLGLKAWGESLLELPEDAPRTWLNIHTG